MSSSSSRATKKGRSWLVLSPTLLRRAREREGISRKALAERLGVSPGAIQNWESASSTPSVAMQQRLASALRIADDKTTEETVVQRAQPAPPPPPQPRDVSNAVAVVLSAMIDKGMVSSMVEVREAIQALTESLR